jgi:hypothetical protein
MCTQQVSRNVGACEEEEEVEEEEEEEEIEEENLASKRRFSKYSPQRISGNSL